MGLFRLVDLDMLLHATHHRTSQVRHADRVLSDFAKCDHRVLIVIAVEGQRSTRGDFAGTLRREQDQLESIRNFENTIFDGNTRHCETLHWARESVYIWGQSADGNSKRRRAGAPESLRLTLVGAGAYRLPFAGRMAEWLCRGLQILVQRFDSASGLQGSKLFFATLVFGFLRDLVPALRGSLCVIPL